MTNKKLPKGSKLSLVKTQGLNPGDYNLYNLQGLTSGKVQFLVDLLTDSKLQGNALATDILSVIPTVSLWGAIDNLTSK